MAYIIDLKGKSPKMGKDCFLAPNASIIGEVEMGNGCSIWFGAVLRGDVHYIKIGNNVNIQDNATIHATYQKSPTTIGNNVSIAHNAVVHGCTIKDNALVGMGAVVLKGTHVESGSVYAGSPAKKIKELSPELLEGEINRIANSYAMYASWYE